MHASQCVLNTVFYPGTFTGGGWEAVNLFGVALSLAAYSTYCMLFTPLWLHVHITCTLYVYCISDNQGQALHVLCRLVVLRCPLLRDDHWPVSFWW